MVQYSDSLQVSGKDCEECLGLVLKYFLGDSVPKDTVKAMDLMYKAAVRGCRDAECFLGYMLYANKNYLECVRWLTKASEKGDPEAQCLLGDCFLKGQGCDKDTLAAIKWYDRARSCYGYDDAGVKLRGLGVKPWSYATTPFVRNSKYFLSE